MNALTLHATDLAGNIVTTNFNVTLDYATDTTPPVLNIIWPQAGTLISGNNFTVRAQVDDATATMVASMNGDTNAVQGLMERNGLVWFNNLPLATGTNILTVTATDAAGNSTTTNLTLVQSGVMVTVDPLNQFNQSSVTVAGTISDPSYDVWVNGVEAYYIDDNGDWEADEVPVSPTGTAVLDVELYSGVCSNLLAKANLRFQAQNNPDGAPVGSQWNTQSQPPMVVLGSYQEHSSGFSDPSSGWNEATYWDYMDGGSWNDNDWGGGNGIDVVTRRNIVRPAYADHWDGTIPPDGAGFVQPSTFDPVWESGSANTCPQYSSYEQSVASRVMIAPGGPAIAGQNALYLVSAQVIDEDSGLQVPGNQVQIRGTTPTDVTNDDGSVWSEVLVTAPAGVNAEVTPKAPVQKISFNGMLVNNVTLNLRSVNFNGTSILQDNGNGCYPTPHWTNDDSGTVQNSPVLYTSGYYVDTVTEFKVSGGGSFPLIIKGEVSGGSTRFTLWGTNSSSGTDGSVVTLADTSLTASKVDFYNPMTIKWYYGDTNKQNFIYAGTSTNQVYVSLATPATTNLYHTVVHLACTNPGATDASTAAANTWAMFSNGTGPANVKTWDGWILYYYKTNIAWAVGSDGNQNTKVNQLLRDGNGQCDSWRQLLESAWLVNGITSQGATVSTVNDPGQKLFLLNNWTYDGSTFTNTPPYNYLFILNSDYSMVGVGNYGDLQNDSGVAGQNSPTPAEKAFEYHFIQKLNGTYYDPSYGVTYSSASDFENKAVAGYGYMDSQQTNTSQIRYRVEQSTGAGEIQINP